MNDAILSTKDEVVNNSKEELKRITKSMHDKLNGIRSQYLAQHNIDGLEAELNDIVAAGKAGIDETAKQIKCELKLAALYEIKEESDELYSINRHQSRHNARKTALQKPKQNKPKKTMIRARKNMEKSKAKSTKTDFSEKMNICGELYAMISIAAGKALQKMNNSLLRHGIAADGIGFIVPDFMIKTDDILSHNLDESEHIFSFGIDCDHKNHQTFGGIWESFFHSNLEKKITAVEALFNKVCDEFVSKIKTNEKIDSWVAERNRAAKKELNDQLEIVKESSEKMPMLELNQSFSCLVEHGNEPTREDFKMFQHAYTRNTRNANAALRVATDQLVATVFCATRYIEA